MNPATYVYVDGFNLYYGAVKDSAYRWLNIRRLCELLLPHHTIQTIKYFTARISARKDDPDKPTRQQIFLRALRTLPDFDIIYGKFISRDVMMPLKDPPAKGPRLVKVIRRMMPLKDPPAKGPRLVKVIRTEEKGSDVNIATHLIHDAHQQKFKSAVLVTNDSDLREPIRIVRDDLDLEVGVLNPNRHTTSQVLAEQASFIKQIREGPLKASQFPDTLRDGTGEFHKPEAW